MAKAKNLAGLAALGALGYMLTRDKPQQENKGRQSEGAGYQSTETRLESPEDTIKRSMVKAPGDSKPITEADVVMPEKAAPVKSRVPAAAVADNTTGITMPTGSPDAEAGKTRGRPKAEPSVSSSAEGMKNYKPRYTPSAAAPKTTTTPVAPKKPYMPEEVDMGYKKGGKVKKMASGGMTASKRADGIASRGKTRCKMY
jgi:hypothetical protein